MTEQEAQDWVIAQFGREAQARLARLVEIVIAEAPHQNLIAPSTLTAMWSRHIVDSAQLIPLADARAGSGPWLDIGSGAGFPGLVVALLVERQVILVEPRRRRATFLQVAATALDVGDRVEILCADAASLAQPCAVISARAVAPLVNLFGYGSNCATHDTIWVLPKGRTAREELASAEQAWHGMFHVEHSVTDPQSLIVLASGVSRR